MADRPRSMAGAGASPSDPDPLSSPRWLQFQGKSDSRHFGTLVCRLEEGSLTTLRSFLFPDDWRPSPASSRSDGSLGPGFGHGLVASFPRASSLYDDIDKWEELEVGRARVGSSFDPLRHRSLNQNAFFWSRIPSTSPNGPRRAWWPTWVYATCALVCQPSKTNNG